MKTAKWTGIALAAALMIMLTGYLIGLQSGTQMQPLFSAEVFGSGGTERVDCWMNGEGKCFLFLPGYAEMEEVRMKMNTENPVFIDGVQLTGGMDCGAFQTDTEYELVYEAWGREQRTTVAFLRSSAIAAMYIDTASGAMEYIHSKKGNEESGDVRLYRADGTLDYSGRVSDIHGRGNNTWDAYDKKPYSLNLQEEADLLDMGRAERWILLANAGDPSHMRNRIVYDFADEIGMAFTPGCEWVDLFLNGEYAGLYLLSERNEVHPERVNIELEESFLVSLEPKDRIARQEYSYIATKAGQALRIHAPQSLSEEKLQSLEQTWQSVENAILAENGTDSATGKGWKEVIDAESWVKKYLVEEIFGSGDACFISQFFWKNAGGTDDRVYAGPVWDFDRSMGLSFMWELVCPQTMYANRLKVKDGFDAPWFHALYQKEEFRERIAELYETEFLPRLDRLFSERIFEYADRIERAGEMNRQRWGIDQDVRSEAEYISEFMKQRMDFLSSIWTEGREYYVIKADHTFGGFYGYYYVEPGQCLSDLPVLENTENMTFLGWYRRDNGEAFRADQPVWEDMEIVARWQDKPNRTLGQIGKLLPLGVIAVMFMILLAADIRRIKRGG